MRYAVIIAGGSGTRLWPMSRADLPKQLIPFIGGKSLLQIAVERLAGLVAEEQQYLCAGEGHREAICRGLASSGFSVDRYLGEPMGRDTLNAVGFVASVLHRQDPDAVIAVFTADHIIRPVDEFQKIVRRGFDLVDARPGTLVTFGISPGYAATGYGYLQLGEAIGGGGGGGARVVDEFKEKPVLDVARRYLEAGPSKYLWNSGMFVWKAGTLLECIGRYRPQNFAGLKAIGDAWWGPDRERVLGEVYPTLEKISVDFAVMEPASRDGRVGVAAIPMELEWLDVGSWPSFAQTCPVDSPEAKNALGAERHLLLDSSGTLVASSDPRHLIATIGCRDMIVIHTPDATLVCPAERAEEIKRLHEQVRAKFGGAYL